MPAVLVPGPTATQNSPFVASAVAETITIRQHPLHRGVGCRSRSGKNSGKIAGGDVEVGWPARYSEGGNSVSECFRAAGDTHRDDRVSGPDSAADAAGRCQCGSKQAGWSQAGVFDDPRQRFVDSGDLDCRRLKHDARAAESFAASQGRRVLCGT